MNILIGTASLLFSALMACNSSSGQRLADDKVPQEVKAAFAARFPSATKVNWEMEDSTTYEVNFRFNNSDHSASFDPNGTWMETEMKITLADLPGAVNDAVFTGFPGHLIKEMELVLTPEGTFYEVEVKKDKHTTEVLVLTDGTIVSTKAEAEDGDATEDR